jgi:hypothetical protein
VKLVMRTNTALLVLIEMLRKSQGIDGAISEVAIKIGEKNNLTVDSPESHESGGTHGFAIGQLVVNLWVFEVRIV